MKPLTPNQTAYLNKMIELANAFKKAYLDLSSHFSVDDVAGTKPPYADEDRLSCNDFIVDQYPFHLSFDELGVSEWVASIEEKANAWLNDEQASG